MNNKFIDALNNPLLEKGIRNPNLTLTENEALAFKSTGNAVLDFFSKSGAITPGDLAYIELFGGAFVENPLLATKALFYSRDIRGGQGVRWNFRLTLLWLAINYPETVLKNLHLVAEYGRWDDLWILIENAKVLPVDSPIAGAVIELVKSQLTEDLRDNGKVSLLAKWMPSINAGKASRELARQFTNYLEITPATYRKVLSQLRKELKIVERFMSANEWNAIDYSTVPSQAFKLYRKAFEKRDPERFAEFLAAVERKHEGDDTVSVKINTGAISPVQLSGVYTNAYYSTPRIPRSGAKVTTDHAVEAQWKELPQYLLNGNVLAVIDTSASMLGDNAISTAISLGLVTAEQNAGAFEGVAICFSSRPRWLTNLGKDRSLRDRVLEIIKINDCSNTDFEATQRLIIDHAVRNNVPQEDMPKVVVVISDMQFDHGSTRYTHTGYEMVKAEYRKAGYEVPLFVWWNVRASFGQPVLKADLGTILVSGDSMGVFKSVASADLDPSKMTPEYFMLQVLESDRYSAITI